MQKNLNFISCTDLFKVKLIDKWANEPMKNSMFHVMVFWFDSFGSLLAEEAVLIQSAHFFKVAVARGWGRLLVVCFHERGEVCVSPRLLPPGKPSVAVDGARRRDAEDADAQVGGDLEAHARTVAR